MISGQLGTNQSGRMTWNPAGCSALARRNRPNDNCGLMWQAPIWKGVPAARHLFASSSFTRSNSSSVCV